jgi:hypothetical protein
MIAGAARHPICHATRVKPAGRHRASRIGDSEAPPTPHIRRTNAYAVDRNRRATSYPKGPCQQS